MSRAPVVEAKHLIYYTGKQRGDGVNACNEWANFSVDTRCLELLLSFKPHVSH